MRNAFHRWQTAASGTPLGFKYRSYMLQISVPVYDALGWEVTDGDWDKKCAPIRQSHVAASCARKH